MTNDDDELTDEELEIVVGGSKEVRILFENWRKFLKEDELIEKLYKALGEDNQKVFKALTTEQQLDLARQWEQAGMPGSLLSEAITIDIDVGDIVLGGKYKNKRMTVKEIGKDELGQPTVNGKPILKFRTEKHLPDNKKSKKTLDLEKAEKEKEKLDEAESALPPGFEGFDVDDTERDPDHEALASLDQGDEFIIGRRKQVYRVTNKAKDALIKYVIKVGTRGRNKYEVRRVNPEGFVVAPFKVIRADGTSEKKPAAPAGLITKVGHTEVRDW